MLRNSLAVGAALALLPLCAAAQSTGADAYRLTSGDVLAIDYVGDNETLEARVDVDGNVRLPDVGGVDVVGLTLDDAETRIEEAIAEAGLFVDPRASLTIRDYAPIVVTGDVSAPGRFDYIPGMTVATALGLSGGTQAGGISRYEIERATAETAAQLKSTNLQIADIVVRIARLEAMLANDPVVELDEADTRLIPADGAVDLQRMIASATDLLTNDLARSSELLAFWEQEIETIEDQRRLFARRIELQEENLERVGDDLETARQLQERGLQTASRLSSAEQQFADAQTRLLELETAQISAAQSVASAERSRTSFNRERQERILSGLDEARLALDEAQLRYARFLEQQAILSGGNIGTLISSEIIDIKYQIRSARSGNSSDAEITADTPISPGDTLIVQVEAATISGG